jgi:hypothetical protein
MNGVRAVLAVGLTLLAVPAWAEGLAVRPGLWEASSSGGPAGGGAPHIPPEALARMSPDQQAMLRQRMAGGGAAAPHRYCVTPAMLRKGFAGPNNQPNCSHTVVSNTASEVRITVACTGAHPSNGTITVHPLGDTGVSGTMDLSVGDGRGGSMPVHREFESHWVGPDCGNIRPAE